VLAQIREEYPDDVRLVYRHFPLVDIHDKAQLAAEAAEAAGAQGKFWEMHERLYETYTAWADFSPADFRTLLDTYAEEIGLDTQQFAADLDSGKFTKKVEDAFNAAASIPLPGTPFVLFNGVPYQGPQEHWAFAALIKLERLKEQQYPAAPPDIIDPFRQYFATLRTEKGDIVIQLFAEQTPLTVNNFVFLAREGWFDGVTFHRVIPGFVVQSGDPSGTGFGGPGYFIPDEIAPDLNFDGAGWVGMANAGPDTNGSQFFITLAPLNDLNGKYTLFGKVVSGLEVLSQISPRDPSSDPEAPPGDVIISVTIEEK
jgi:cyclophilin family peptidyl-prolyl cis-trans isomerase